MKIANKNKDKKHKIKKKPIVKPKKEKVVIVAQEIKFARLLAGNEKKTRDRVLKTLKKWLLNCFEKGYEFKEDDFIRVWKGLFYAVWMSDKPLVQEELCDTIAGILDLFPAEHLQHAVLFVKAGFKVLATEWYGIDHHRMDKFLMLVRRYLRGSFRCLLRSEWSLDSCQKYSKMLSNVDGIFALKTPIYARNATSMLLHIIDCYLEELAKVSEGNIPDDSITELLRPFCTYLCGGSNPLLCVSCRRLLTALLRQSEQGLQYQDKTQAWQRMGCPNGGPDALELASDDEGDEQNGDAEYEDDDGDNTSKPLDPRAGRVDVELSLLPVPAQQIAALLRNLMMTASSAAHKRVRICMQRFEELSKGEYPLRVKETDVSVPSLDLKPAAAAHSLSKLEKNLVTSADELALRGLSRKHRKRLLAKSRAGLSIVEDVEKLKQDANNSTNGDWEVEAVAEKNKQTENKENVNKKNNKRKLKEETPKNVKKQKSEEKAQNVKLDNKDKVQKNTLKNKQKKEKKNDLKIVFKESEVNVAEKKNKVENKKEVEAKKQPVTEKKVAEKVEKQLKEKKVPEKAEKKIQNGGIEKKTRTAFIVPSKVKNYQKATDSKGDEKKSFATPKKVKFVLKNNSMQGTMDYYKSVRQSPNIPFDSTKVPTKTNLKPSTPSPINPFVKKKLKLKF